MSPSTSRSRTAYALRVVLTVVALCLVAAVVAPSFAEPSANEHYLQKRGNGAILQARQTDDGGLSIPLIPTGDGNGNGNTDTQQTTTTTDNPNTRTTTRDTSTITTPTTTTTSTTSTTSSSTKSLLSAGTVSSVSQSTTSSSRSTSATFYIGTTTYRSANRAPSSTGTSQSTLPADSGDTPFLSHKGAVAATFTVVGIVAVGALVFMGFHLRKKLNDKDKDEDMWEDAASMAEFAAHGNGRGSIIFPSSTSQGGMHRNPSSSYQHGNPEHDPDAMLALPPVGYGQPRDSAYDIVPAPPPSAFTNPKSRRPGADTDSFGSGVGNDPFAGSGFVDATREPYGAAGVGANGGWGYPQHHDQSPYDGYEPEMQPQQSGYRGNNHY